MMDFISQPWPWYVGGLMITVVAFLLLKFGKKLGMSTSYETACTYAGAGNVVPFFDKDVSKQLWNTVFIVGVMIGGFIAHQFLNANEALILSESTIADLQALGIPFDGKLAPEAIFNWDFLMTGKGALIILGGGFLIGFGGRWASGCTSGHAITGLSNLQLPSLVAVIGFFIGGLLMTHLIFPFIF